MQIRHFLFVFLPAIFLLALIFFIRVIQYEPLTPKQKETAPEVATPTKSTIPIFPEDPLLGKKTAAHTVIVFGDFACESCRQEYKLLTELMKEYPQKVKIIWKGLPVKTIPYSSEPANKYGFCAHKQGKFDAWAEVAFGSSDLDESSLTTLASQIELDETVLKTCIASKEAADYIQKTKDLAQVLNIQSVPTTFYKNAQISSPQTIEEWKTVLSL